MIRKLDVAKLNIIISLLIVVMIAFAILPTSIFATEKEQKTVRVGYIVTKNYQEGGSDSEVKSGYGYEYLQKIAGYTGWKYEYVYGTFSELLKKLEDGDIDLMGNISYTEDRAQSLVFSKKAMGTDIFNLYALASRKDIDSSDLSTLNGKKIAVLKGGYQQSLLSNWLKDNNLECEIVLVDGTQAEDEPLKNGSADLCATIDTGDMRNCYPIANIGSSDYYFAMPRKDSKLMKELDKAHYSLLENNPRLNEKLASTYFKASTAVNGLTKEEHEWLSKHSTLRVGFLDNHAPYCYYNSKKKNEVDGIVSLPLNSFSEDHGVTLEYQKYKTGKELFKALENGDIDIASSVLGNLWIAEQEQYLMSDKYATIGLMLYTNTASTSKSTVAVWEAGSLQQQYVQVYYPDAKLKEYESLKKCLKAVSKGEADFTLLSTNESQNYLRDHNLPKNVKTTLLPNLAPLSLAVSKDEPLLKAMINKEISSMDLAKEYDIMQAYSDEQASLTVGEIISKYRIPIILIIVGIIALCVYFYRRTQKLHRMVKKGEEWEYLAKHDDLTGVLNREAYKEIKEKMNEQNIPVGFVMVDIDHFNDFNEEYGKDTGNKLLIKAADILMHATRDDDYVFRFGGDKFVVLLCGVEKKSEEYIKSRYITTAEVLSTSDQIAPAAHFSAGIFFSSGGLNNNCYQIADAALYHTKQNGYAGYTVMNENRDIICEYHDNSVLSINMSKQKLQSSVKTGTWRIEMPESAAPRLYGDDTMLELLGIKKKLSPEECYEQWFSNIDSDYVPVVLRAVEKINSGERTEVSYLWNHPQLGVRKIRCGGTNNIEATDRKEMYGFHQDLTEVTVVMKDDDIRYIMSAMNKFLTCNIYVDLKVMRYTMLKRPDYMAAEGVEKGDVSQLSGALIDRFVREEHREKIQHLINLADIEERVRNRDRISCEYIDQVTGEWQNAMLFPLRYDIHGKLQSVLISVTSIDVEKKLKIQQEQQLLMIRTAYKQMFSLTQAYLGIVNLEDGILKRLDMDHDQVAISKETPYQYDIVTAYAAEHSIVPEDREKFSRISSLDAVKEQLVHSQKYTFQINRIKKDGTTGLFAYQFCYYDENQDSIVVMVEEVTEREEKDSITGELNMHGFRRKVTYILDNKEGEYVMLHFDVDGFKAVNAQLGFERGNKLLRNICESIKESSLKSLAIARISGDHFYCIISKENLDYNEIARLCKQNYTSENTSISITLKCGIYEVVDKNMTIHAMCDRARLAKTALKNDNLISPYYVFTEKLNRQYLSQKAILDSLDFAVENEEFCNYFQPIFNAKTKEIASAEALVRWIKSDGEVIKPDVFIPALEESGQISVVDILSGKRIAEFQRERYMHGKKIVPISVNLSRMDLYNDDLLTQIYNSVKASKIPCKYMRFEITESAYTDIPEHALKVMRLMREHGAKLLIDDFGKGYSSLSTLAEQIFDIVKLDMSFIEQIGVNSRAEAIIASSINMAHKMSAEVIAEGVETEEQYEFLRDCDCDYIQGYYLSKPLTQDDFAEFLDKK